MIHVVTGGPCSGKTTHVAEHRTPESIVVDLDALAHALGYPHHQLEWNDTHPVHEAAHRARWSIINAVLTGKVRTETWIIDSDPSDTMRAKYRRVRARFHHLEPGRDECLARAERAGRPDSTLEAINLWHDQRGR